MFVIFALVTIEAQAVAPRDVDDLVGARASSGESELEDRGYHHRKTLRTSNGSIDYWWSSRRQACIAVTTRDGRFKSIMTQPEAVCDSGESSHSGGHHGGGNRGSHVTLYEHDDFRGRTFDARDSRRNLKDEGFNDTASSVEIHGGNWELCDDANYQGRCITLDPGSYESLRDMGLNDRVSSIRRTSHHESGHSSNHGGSAIPQVTRNRDGTFRVTFPNDACMAFYDRQGYRTNALNQCGGDQIRRADDAVRSYLREQGGDHSAPGYSSGGGSPPRS